MRLIHLAAALFTLGLISCQPKEPEKPSRPRHQAAVLDYTMLGIWPERYQAYEISNALGEFGIRSTLSGRQPCILNVEAAKLGQAQAMVAANPAWQQTRIR